MKIKDCMHQGVVWSAPETPLKELAKRMREEDIGAIPIGENDKLVGMVTDRDIACRGLDDGKDVAKLCARDVMSKPIIYCRADEEVEDAIRIMAKHEVRRLPVINADKRMVGMLSLGDISAKMARDISGEAIKAVSAHHA
jgi:CBS domain-containing protein